MTLTLELPADLETRLAAEAADAGMSLPAYTLHLLEMSAYRDEWTDEDLADARTVSMRYIDARVRAALDVG